ncbi:PadR family transcriptional regulator [Georgenia sp. SUBG003]|uniref:PadR family transcriptional regulator n=1 Tax=Georgenia sp. SUBG003 TaxID=1497974 RepID=UPI003AB13AA4
MPARSPATRDPQLLKGVLPMLVLALLREQDSYGYELVTRLQDSGLTDVATGSVYPVLTRLERDGHLASYLVASPAGPARKYYTPTDAGLDHLGVQRRSWQQLGDVVAVVMTPRPAPDPTRPGGTTMTAPGSAAATAPRAGLRDRLRRERYLLALVLWLDDDYPAAQRRALVAQLRGDLDAAAADTSMPDAISSLGPARRLAGEYSDLLDRRRPRWGLGAACAAGWLLLALVATAIFAWALWQVAPATGTGGATARLLWAELTVVNTPRESSLAWRSGFPWTLIVTLAVFAVGARAWRAFPRRRRPAENAPAGQN